jgi:hypothetical protein
MPTTMPTVTKISRPFRFGVLAETSRTPQDLLATVHTAEASGYSTLLSAIMSWKRRSGISWGR